MMEEDTSISVTLSSGSEYTVGWVTALPLELAAAIAMLDEEHDPPRDFDQPSTDNNVYVFGRIRRHNVVIATLSAGQYGKVSATATAVTMLSSFPAIKVGLMVGIAAGVPNLNSDTDIRLGDVVVSQRRGRNGGVIQYDSTKALDSDLDVWQRNSFETAPPEFLLKALAKLQARHMTRPSQIPSILRGLGPYMTTGAPLEKLFVYQGAATDRLFLATSRHEGGGNHCDKCNSAHVIERKPRASTDPRIFYGLVASGDTLIKDGIYRDQLLARIGEPVLCFETEAAGLVGLFPCLIIRGICDYADSHKNDRWQRYAAATAAAFAKEFLDMIPIRDVQRAKNLKDVMSTVQSNLDEIKTSSTNTETMILQTHKEAQRAEMLEIADWFSKTDHFSQHRDHLVDLERGTGKWLIQTREFQAWLSGEKATLFCAGAPGAGKTMIACMIVDHLHQAFKDDLSVGIATLYCKYNRQHEQTLPELLACLIKQFIPQQQVLDEVAKKLHLTCVRTGRRPNTEDLEETLESVVTSFPETYLILDAWDECELPRRHRLQFLSALFDIQKKANLKILFTSRPLPHTEELFETSPRLEIRAQDQDIELYLSRNLNSLEQLDLDEALCEDIATTIIGSIDGMFLLAKLYLDIIKTQLTKKGIRACLARFRNVRSEQSSNVHISDSRAYDLAYDEAKKRIEGQSPESRSLAEKALSWITLARRPVAIKELCVATAVEEDEDDVDDDSVPHIKTILSICAGLVSVDQQSQIVRFVHYTTQDYFERLLPTWLPHGPKFVFKVCLRYASMTKFSDSASIGWASMVDRLRVDTLYEYVCCHWGDHCHDLEEEDVGTVLEVMSNDRLRYSLGRVASMARMFFMAVDGSAMFKVVSPLHICAYFGLEASIRVLLDTQALDVNMLTTAGLSPLAIASARGQVRAVEALLDRPEIDVNAGFASSNTALNRAITFDCLEVMNLLLSHPRIDVSRARSSTQPLLSFAVQCGSPRIVHGLLKNPQIRTACDVPDPSNHGRTPLVVAARNGMLETVELLIQQYHADMNSKDNYGRSALSLAAEQGAGHVVEYLLQQPTCDVNTRDEHQFTPLLRAVFYGHVETTACLLQHPQIDINAHNKSLKTALLYAAEIGHVQIAELLLSRHTTIDLSCKDGSGKSALSHAAAGGYTEIVKLLLPFMSEDINLPDNFGATPLLRVARVGYEDIVEILLQCPQIDVNMPDRFGKSPLSHAVERGHEAVVAALLAFPKQDVNIQDRHGRTPLMCAAERGNIAIMKLLLEMRRADINVLMTDTKGETARAIAYNKWQTDAVNLLDNVFF